MDSMLTKINEKDTYRLIFNQAKQSVRRFLVLSLWGNNQTWRAVTINESRVYFERLSFA